MRGGGRAAPRVNEPQKSGARSARARTHGQNSKPTGILKSQSLKYLIAEVRSSSS
jgi:hypothetical protein